MKMMRFATSRAKPISWVTQTIVMPPRASSFILKLSFFGWLLLCVFTFGIGGFFLEPYMQATYAEFYAAMRSKALAMGMTTTDELGGFVRHDTYPNDMDF